MSYKVNNNDMSALCGTCLRGYVYATYDQLVEMFGQPRDDIDKSSAHWAIRFDDGEVASIYDWKTQVVPENMYRWHIGGHRDDMPWRIDEILKLEKVALNAL